MKMMTNLFSTFDPTTGAMSMNWASMMLILILPKKFWVANNMNMIIIMKMLNIMKKETEALTKIKGLSLMTNAIMVMIMMINLMGLLPYIFTPSSHLTFSMSLSVSLWLSIMIYGWTNKTDKMFKHLVPMSTPMILMPFMVMIETISNFMRPGSLAVRLTANMIAGHMLMSLLGESQKSLMLLIMLIIIYMMLMMFEFAVAIIQAYVFMTLSSLYSSEV
uniref:ATP synthase subunit a n=1 Tax=Nacolus tuberculatus TaxID=2800230 RepID=A0A7T6YCS6_9HEMI|nr:ATP synthase F0 subunit 6 [Nacolus tuberculatus]QQK57724.1 ATP synthase F0 subunit 6 [Nacolus tuberculatus]